MDLVIHVINAIDLVAADDDFSSDPYCIVQVTTPCTRKGHPVCQSLGKARTSVKKKTLTPEWKDKLIFYVEDPDSVEVEFQGLLTIQFTSQKVCIRETYVRLHVSE
jgi:hypothetical protein